MTEKIESLLRPPARGVLVCESGAVSGDQANRIRSAWNEAIEHDQWPIILSGVWRWLDVDEAETTHRDDDAGSDSRQVKCVPKHPKRTAQ